MENELKAKEKKLKKYGIICGVLGLVTAVIAFIFMFLNVISYNVTIFDGQAVSINTNISKLLGSDYNLSDGEISMSVWSLCNAKLDPKEIKDSVQILCTLFAWVELVGCIASVVLYVLFMLNKKLFWACETATRAVGICSVILMLAPILGYLPNSGIKFYAEGVNYNMVLPIIYSVVMLVLEICVVKFLASYKKEQAAYDDLRSKQPVISQQTAYVLKEQEAQGEIYAEQAYGNTAQLGTVEGNETWQTDYYAPVNDEAKNLVMERLKGNLKAEQTTDIIKRIQYLNYGQYQKLTAMPVKNKVTTILLAVFLGGLGVDRFYIGETGVGVLKLVGSIVAALLNLVPVLGVIASIANGIWKFVDIFFSYKRACDINYVAASAILSTDN